MLNIEEFLKIAIAPQDSDAEWLEGAASAVNYAVVNSNSADIILYTAVGQTYFHSVLTRLDKVTPPDADDLRRSHAGADAAWAIEHSSGGGEPDRIYLSAPLDRSGCKSLIGGEQLVFRRSFTGVDKGEVRTELSQRLVQALDLYWLDEESAYCRLNEDGDIEPIIRVLNMSKHTGQSHDVLVTIDGHQLHRYMTVTDTALVMKFDFTRYRPDSFAGWGNLARGEYAEGDLFYHSGLQSGCSFAHGVLIVRPLLTKDTMIARYRREWSDEGKQYATFMAQDWKNNRLAEISCAPTALASYFEKDSSLPFQVTPAFFKPEVLQKYKANPEKYTLEHRSIHSRAGWYLKTYDVNEAGQVHTYLCYLADLRFTEQLYWKAYNERPKAAISKRAYQTDFEGSVSTIADPLVDLKRAVETLDQANRIGGYPAEKRWPQPCITRLTTSPEEWGSAILALDQLVVEGFVPKALKARLAVSGRAFDKQWGSIRLLQECLVGAELDEAAAASIAEPFKKVHNLRSKVKGHAAETDKQALIKAARTDHGSLAAHFRHLVTELQTAFDRMVELL